MTPIRSGIGRPISRDISSAALVANFHKASKHSPSRYACRTYTQRSRNSVAPGSVGSEYHQLSKTSPTVPAISLSPSTTPMMAPRARVPSRMARLTRAAESGPMPFSAWFCVRMSSSASSSEGRASRASGIASLTLYEDGLVLEHEADAAQLTRQHEIDLRLCLCAFGLQHDEAQAHLVRHAFGERDQVLQ